MADKHGYGYHPLLAWLDNTGETLAGMLRPGNANANAAADHISVTDEALAQIPDAYRYGTPILIRADGAGARVWAFPADQDPPPPATQDQGFTFRYPIQAPEGTAEEFLRRASPERTLAFAW